LLGFAEASAGIARTQRENREGWWAHARHSKAFILDAAARVARPRLAVVLGAGKAYDLPLQELAQRFERLILIDIDAAALEATRAATVRGANVELRAMDLTGVTAQLARGIGTALDSPSPEGALQTLCRSYRLVTPPRFLPDGERADLLVSAMVLSQLGLQPKLAARRLYEARLGKPFDDAMGEPWNELEQRLQQDHIDALADQAELVVLASDVVHRSGPESWSVIGAQRLEERIPPFMKVLKKTTWSWPRVRAALGREAVETSVEALLLERASAK